MLERNSAWAHVNSVSGRRADVLTGRTIWQTHRRSSTSSYSCILLTYSCMTVVQCFRVDDLCVLRIPPEINNRKIEKLVIEKSAIVCVCVLPGNGALRHSISIFLWKTSGSLTSSSPVFALWHSSPVDACRCKCAHIFS